MPDQINTIQGSNALVSTEPTNIMGLRTSNRVDELYSPEYFGGLSQLAGAAAKSKLFGDLTPDQLFIILMTGREMGLPPTVALRNIGSFKGKTVITSQLQLAKVKEAGYLVKIVENTDERATVSVQRKGEEAYTKTFTMADAIKAGLPERNALYKTNPSTMLLNRAIGIACRYGAPEVLNGLYNETELIEVDDPGHVAAEPKTVTGSTSSPMAEAVVNGWTIEAQETFAELKDRLYEAFKEAGKLDKHPAESEKWQKRMTTDEASKVNAGLLAFVEKLEAAAKKAKANTDDKIIRDESGEAIPGLPDHDA